jgi:hypothetical protein
MTPESFSSFRIIAVGEDGVRIATLSEAHWSEYVNAIHANGEIQEWYAGDMARASYNILNRGYFPQGVTIGNTITVRSGAKGNLDLLAHEYGHALGLKHTGGVNPDVMNPVAWLRVTDNNNLRQRFKENFPTYAESFMAVPPSRLFGLLAVGAGVVAWSQTRSMRT